MTSSRGVAYIKRDEVQVESIDFPKFVDRTTGMTIEHGVTSTRARPGSS
jgi:hypothetical protein